MRKILYISGTRADYGLMRRTLFCIKRHPKLKIKVVVTGMHLMTEFGKTINEIRKDKFKIHELKVVYKYDSKASMVNFIGELILKLAKTIEKINPDMILVLGDRAEMLAAAIVGVYLTIPVVHIQGGDVTSTVDEVTRHAITKLANIHLTATKKSAQKIIKMGEEAWRVHIVGAPALDSILHEKLLFSQQIKKKFSLNLEKPILLVIQHPVTTQIGKAAIQMKNTMEAIRNLQLQTVLIYPNADAGGRAIIKVIEQYRQYYFIKLYRSLPHTTYLSLLKISTVMIGNSSSGIVEAPSFCLPAVNIGVRQQGRERANNVIDVEPQTKAIIMAVKKALYDKNFRRKVKRCKNPYGDGKSSERIAKILSKVKINEKLLQKRLTYS